MSENPEIEAEIDRYVDKTGLSYAAARAHILGHWMVEHAEEVPLNPALPEDHEPQAHE